MRRGARLVFEISEEADAQEIKKLFAAAPTTEHGVECEAVVSVKGSRGIISFNDRIEPTDHLVSILRTLPGVARAHYEYGYRY